MPSTTIAKLSLSLFIYMTALCRQLLQVVQTGHSCGQLILLVRFRVFNEFKNQQP
jgi:hypothetical protein